MSKRAERRVHARRMKARARRLGRRWFEHHQEWLTDQWVGRMASTHCRPCSCYLCQPCGRKKSDVAADLSFSEQVADVMALDGEE